MGQDLIYRDAGLQKLCTRSGVGACWMPKLYLGAQNIQHVVTLYCVMLFSRYFVAILFAFSFMKLTWQMKKHETKGSINMVSSSILYMCIKKDRDGSNMTTCPILCLTGSLSHFRHPLFQHV